MSKTSFTFTVNSTKINKETFKIFFKEFPKHPLKQMKKLISGIKTLLGAIYESFTNGVSASILTLSPYVGFVIAYIIVIIATSILFYFIPYLSIGLFAISAIYFILSVLGF